MRYRILDKNGSYEVQYRPRWWPFWTRDSRYILYDKPREIMRYGGFFGNMGYKDTESGYHSSSFYSQQAAEDRIRLLKSERERRKERRKERRNRKVVFTSTDKERDP